MKGLPGVLEGLFTDVSQGLDLVFMATLRKKIEPDPSHPRYIQTHIGVGYRMIRQPDEEAGAESEA